MSTKSETQNEHEGKKKWKNPQKTLGPKKMMENKEQGSRGERRPGILFVSIVWHRM